MDRALALFADLLSYPGEDVAALARECERAGTASGFPAGPLEEFRKYVEAAPRETLEELYTDFFDLNPNASPYVGYHLYGEGYARSLFLLELQKKYRTCGFDAGRELADHLCVMLRYLADCDDQEAREELVSDALLPALLSMIEKTGEGRLAAEKGGAAEEPRTAPYRLVLEALRAGLKGE
jgi:nitrate reductase molybdenum cofactor assembly chaperone